MKTESIPHRGEGLQTLRTQDNKTKRTYSEMHGKLRVQHDSLHIKIYMSYIITHGTRK